MVEEALDVDVPPSELVECRRAAAAGAQSVDGADDDADDAHEAVRLLDELRVADQLVAPGVAERKHALHRRTVLEDAQEHLRAHDTYRHLRPYYNCDSSAIRARFERDSSTIRARHAATRYEVYRALVYEIDSSTPRESVVRVSTATQKN